MIELPKGFSLEPREEGHVPPRWWEHDWQMVDMQKTFGNACLLKANKRVCSKCGLVQEETQDNAWMRWVGGKYWYPSTRDVGRKCPKGVKPNG